ncbi:MAG: short-chain dehydrogenase [Candidatus Marinimicrobia bacterium]|nr:short-chain dehydrogenase [Candidatus Neomarinimicrobiota bacterium]
MEDKLNVLSNQNIFITGGNRGIGLGLLKGLSVSNNVIFSVRDKDKGEKTLEEIKNLHADYVVMDVDDTNSIEVAVGELKNKLSKVDILFNNAGILLKEYDVDAVDTPETSILKTFNTNTLGVLRVCRSVIPLMKNGGRIINVSSGMGQLEDMESGSIAYRLSKTALNALSKVMSNELSSRNIKVNVICPGWVQTDMGGSSANLTVEESTDRIIKFALEDSFPNGKFLQHGEIIPW